MTDLVPELNLESQIKEKVSMERDRTRSVNYVESDDSGSNKIKDRKKRSVSSVRRNHPGSKPSVSHKKKSTQKMVNTHRSKENRDNVERSSENRISLKEETHSDERNSSVSDSNTPVHVTRARFRRIERRKAYSSYSSAMDSDNRKTKSEPIIITLDSDSDDNTSMLSGRPNRTARIRGELIRKLSGTTTKISVFKRCDSSSSSDYENLHRKKKSKPKSVKASSTQSSKRKKFLVSRVSCQKRLKLRKHAKLSHVYRPIKNTRDIRSITKRYEAQKKKKEPLLSNKKSQHNEKRALRSTSTDTAVDNAIRNETVPENENLDVKSSEIGNQSSETLQTQLKNLKQEIVDKEIEKDTNSETCEYRVEEKKELKSDEEIDINMKQKNSPTDMKDKIAEKGMDNSHVQECKANIQPTERPKKKKKKIKPVDKIVRKRGRPRLTEMKPIKDIPILNDMIQIPFLQSSFCFNVAAKLSKCRECRIAVNRSSRSLLHAYCRFMEYRKLCYSKTGLILNAGFSEPSDATIEHLNQWLPELDHPPKDLNCNTSKALVEHIGDQFCDLIEQEKEALSLHIGKDRIVTWKRIVQGVREMCDVCYTTIFNIHWVCPICGLAVCIDCYKGRKQGIVVEDQEGLPKNRDQYNWLLCTLRQPHDPEKLVMAQIIPGNALWDMRDLLHKARKIWNIPSYCKCNPQEVTRSDKYISSGICKQLMSFVTKSFSTERSHLYYTDSSMQNGDNNYDDLDIEVTGAALKWLEGAVCSNNLEPLRHADEYFNTYEDFASLRVNLLSGINNVDITSESERDFTSFSVDDIVECVTKSQDNDDKENCGKAVVKHFSNRYPQACSGRDPLPIRIYTKLESNLAFSNVPHSWFCNGRLLFLHQADHKDNLALFQEQWKRGQPITVKGVDERLNMDLWHPDAFCRDFGEVKNDLVDCRTGAILKYLPMKRFWEGFESLDKRMKDDNGEYMLLKLKDWPPGEDFSEMLPKRFHDLMSGLPLPEYTHRDGILNLAGRLPPWFVRPDLGPKMYNAYGSALYPTKGTTNLHLDVSDAVNVMVYVGIPSDGNAQLHIEEALKAIDEGGCDSLMRARVRARGAKPGALWHIYNARDADKIRLMLTKVGIERGEKLEANHDPIHDQSWYLDSELRKRLYKDYGVEGYAIAQCLGDAVFIPAGAPHQVRNLHSCVKVAEDFVSPENIAHCFKLTQEFRHLSDTHTNHEDKLQIKNIIYHVVRDALAHLLSDGNSVES